MLHQCAAEDANGQVSKRWWGENHPYLPLWPLQQEISFGVPIRPGLRENWVGIVWHQPPSKRSQ